MTNDPQTSQRLHDFVEELIASLNRRYAACEDFAATPSSILLATLNAVEDARKKAGI